MKGKNSRLRRSRRSRLIKRFVFAYSARLLALSVCLSALLFNDLFIAIKEIRHGMSDYRRFCLLPSGFYCFCFIVNRLIALEFRKAPSRGISSTLRSTQASGVVNIAPARDEVLE